MSPIGEEQLYKDTVQIFANAVKDGRGHRQMFTAMEHLSEQIRRFQIDRKRIEVQLVGAALTWELEELERYTI